MENASKALIIAGGMLIAMLVVSLLVWGFTSLSEFQKEKAAIVEREQILEFNKKFEAYNKNTVRGYQIISLSNLASDINTRYEEEVTGYKKIQIRAMMDEEVSLPEATTNEKVPGTKYYDMIKYITNVYDANKLDVNQKNEFKQYFFECTDVIYDNDAGEGRGTGRIVRMLFKQVKVKKST